MDNTTQVSVVQTKTPAKEERVAYTIRDNLFRLEVLESANAWWNSRIKVERLIIALKSGLSVRQSCIQAHISEMQYKYFVDRHPDFYNIKAICEEVSAMAVETGISHHIRAKDKNVLMWAAERINPDKWAKKEGFGLAQPGTTNNIQQVINQTVVFTGSLAERLRKREEAKAAAAKPQPNGNN